ncbi:hypothetical protein H0H87_001332 [Tephrocybe sp. NHM501043]|nr:hypothetical protein H0H87_001332 [Tephrocybe sp. NHM501043]
MDAYKWKAGTSYGPVLSQTDLYLLRCELELHPILQGKAGNFHLIFSLVTGQTSGFNADARDRDLPFAQKDEPATLPRVKQLILITDKSPWCTVVTNENGVTMNDICIQMYKEYTNLVTPQEFTSLPARTQEAVKRLALNNVMNAQMAANGWPGQQQFYPQTPAPIPTDQIKRYGM